LLTKKKTKLTLYDINLIENAWLTKSVQLLEKMKDFSKMWELASAWTPPDADYLEHPEVVLLRCKFHKNKTIQYGYECNIFQNVTHPEMKLALVRIEKKMESLKKFAKSFDTKMFTSTQDIKTPFMIPNFIWTQSKFLWDVLQEEFFAFFESGIFQRWRKNDMELQQLDVCVREAIKKHGLKRKETPEYNKEVGRFTAECKEKLRGGSDNLLTRLFGGKFRAATLKDMRFAFTILLLGYGLALCVFVFYEVNIGGRLLGWTWLWIVRSLEWWADRRHRREARVAPAN